MILLLKKENDKWFLKKAEDYHISYLTPDIIQHRITLYNYISVVNTNLNFITLTPKDFSVDFTGDFNDKFWENKNFIPLPNWIKKQIK